MKLRKKKNVYDIFVILLVTFMFTTLTFRLWPSWFSINRLLGVAIIFVITYLTFSHLNKNIVWRVFFSITSAAIAILISCLENKEVSLGVQDAIYWYTTMMILINISSLSFCEKMYAAFRRNAKLIKSLSYIMSIFLFICLFVSDCYRTNWEGIYFIGYGFSEHAISSGSCLLSSFLLFLMKEKKYCSVYNGLFFLPAMLSIFQSGARVFLVPLLIILYIFYFDCVTNKQLKYALLPFVVVAFLGIVSRTNVVQKFTTAAQNIYSSPNKLVAFSNGRFDFWLIDLKQFFEYPIFNLIFGKGFENVYYINMNYYYGSKIWAHNDIINTLCSSGVFGLFIYILLVYQVIKNLRRGYCNKKIEMLVTTYLIFPLIFNGFFGIQHFVYSFIVVYLCAVCGKRTD